MPQLYRPNAAAIIVNHDGLLLICERKGNAEAWQFPQGGIDDGETAQQAAEREVFEEVGYRPGDYSMEDARGNYRYDYPEEVLNDVKRKRGVPYVGQEQTYFLCRLHAGAPEPRLDAREFCRYRWIWPVDFKLEWLPPFKREVYRAVLKDFFGVDLTD